MCNTILPNAPPSHPHSSSSSPQDAALGRNGIRQGIWRPSTRHYSVTENLWSPFQDHVRLIPIGPLDGFENFFWEGRVRLARGCGFPEACRGFAPSVQGATALSGASMLFSPPPHRTPFLGLRLHIRGSGTSGREMRRLQGVGPTFRSSPSASCCRRHV